MSKVMCEVKKSVFTVEELSILFQCVVSKAACIKSFDVSPESPSEIIDDDDVDLVRTLRKVCEEIESRVELPF